jgi:hypothetical protein
MTVTWKQLAYTEDTVQKTLFDAYSILAADTDSTPAAIALAASQLIGRKSTGGIVALSKADILTIINVTEGATANTKATGAEIDTGTDDVKFATAKALKDAHNVPSVVPGDSGNFMVSDGTDWTSAAPGAPTAHALSAHTAATANLSLAGYQIEDQVIQTVADEAAVTGYATPVVGKILFSTADLAAYICTVAA